MATFRKVNFEMVRTSSYGYYKIIATYKGKKIEVITTDSEAFDYYNDDSNKEKHQDAKRHCYNKIVEAYNNL